MILTYRECIDRYGTDYKIKKEIKAGRLFRKEKGIYTDEKRCSDIALISARYPRTIFTGESAYYYYGLSDVIPEQFHLVTLRTDSRIKDSEIRQYFVNENLFGLGKTVMTYHVTQIAMDVKELSAMVQQVNETEVSTEYRLSDHVQQYDSKEAVRENAEKRVSRLAVKQL